MFSILPASTRFGRHSSCFRTFATTSARSYSKPRTVGTVPFHQSYILLHTHRPPTEYPARVKSPLQRALLLRTAPFGGQVNFSWSEDHPAHPAFPGLGDDTAGLEVYSATAFSANGVELHIPEVSMENLDAVVEQLREHAVQPRIQRLEKLHLFVCTHGQRDCRCGEIGGDVFQALRGQVKERGIADWVKVGEVGHVGKHEFAANVLVFPYGDWLGTVHPSGVSGVLDEILLRHAADPMDFAGAPPLCPPLWRGRMGLDKEKQLVLHATHPIECA